MRGRGHLNRFLLCVATLGLLAAPAVASAESGAILAVFDMEDRGSGLDDATLVNLTDYLAVLMAEGGYQVVPRDQLKSRLRKQKTDSMKACFDQSCQVELGRELAAQKTLATRIFKIGSRCRVTGTMFDLRRAATEKAASAKADCSEESLGLALEKIAEKLCSQRVDVAQAQAERKAKQEAERRAKAEAELKAKEEAERKAKDEAERRVSEEAERKAKAEAERKAKEEAERRVRQEAERKAKAEAERRAEQAAEPGPDAAGAPADAFRIADTWWHMGLRGGVTTPTLADSAPTWIHQNNRDQYLPDCGEFNLDLLAAIGGQAEVYADFKFGSYFSLGAFAGLYYAELESEFHGQAKEDMDGCGIASGSSPEVRERHGTALLSLGPRFKGRLPIGDRFELRLGLGLGFGAIVAGGAYSLEWDGEGPDQQPQELVDRDNQVDLTGSLGLVVTMGLGAAWFISDGFGLVTELSVLSMPVGVPGDGTPAEYEFSMGPVLTWSLGVEFGG